MNKLKPIINIAPGEFIKEEMEARNWNNEKLSEVTRLSEETICEIINGTQRITKDTAKRLGKAFGQSSVYWFELENNYRFREKGTNDWG